MAARPYLRGGGPGRGYVLGEPSLRCVRRDSFSRNLFEDVSARSGTRTKQVTSYNVVLWCTTLFSDILHVSFPYAPKSRKAAGRTPKIGGKPRNRRRRRFLAGRFLASTSLVATMSAPFGLRLRPETTMEDTSRKCPALSGQAVAGAPARGCRKKRRELASFAKRKWRTPWRLTWCWWARGRRHGPGRVGEAAGRQCRALAAHPRKPISTPSNNSFSGRRAARSRASRCKATSPGSGK